MVNVKISELMGRSRMIKGKISLSLFLIATVIALNFIASSFVQLEIFAPELFALGNGYGFQVANREFFIIHAKWEHDQNFFFIMYGKRNENFYKGIITQIYGEHISSYAPFFCSNEKNYCYKREIKNIWHGWIEFRGHNRPLCGGKEIKNPCLVLEGQ